MAVILPIIIYRDKKSDKELREEMARDAAFRKAVEEDERRQAERKRQIELEKRCEKEARLKKLEDEYYEARSKNPWDFQFLPEGWSIFGQGHLRIVEEY